MDLTSIISISDTMSMTSEERRTLIRIAADLYDRASEIARDQHISMNTLIAQGITLKIGGKKMRYRVEQIWIPATAGVAREGGSVQDIPRRIIHVFETLKEQFDGCVLKVLTEEEEMPSRCPDHGTMMTLNLAGNRICAVPECRFGPAANS